MRKSQLYSLLIVLVLSISCKDRCDEWENPAQRSIEFGFETSLDDWVTLGGGGERFQESDIQISSDYYKYGSSSCKFTVSPESYINAGSRAELTFDQYAYEGDETWYEWSFYLPVDYPDVLLDAVDGSPNWQVLGQWHQQPVVCAGETWDDFEGIGQSPSIALYYNYLTMSDPTYVENLNDTQMTSPYGFNSQWDEVSTITISVGLEAVAISQIRKGEWIDMKFHILWSQTDEGFVEVWKNDTLITNGKVYKPNMLNRASHYFKFGLYRNYSINTTQIVYYDEVSIY